MRKHTGVLFAFLTLGALAGTAEAQGYVSGGKKCSSREVWEDPIKNSAVSIDGFCRPKQRDGYEWVKDNYGGFFRPLVQRADEVYVRGHGDNGKWIEAGWIPRKAGFVWDEGHYKSDGSWDDGQWVRQPAGQEWVSGHWEGNAWVEGYWRPIPPEGPCKAGEVYEDEISFPGKLFVPEYCRPEKRAGYTWKEDQYGGFWEINSLPAGKAFIHGHISGAMGNWIGEELVEDREGEFFIDGRYDAKGNWIDGKWSADPKLGYEWVEGRYNTDGTWIPGEYKFNPDKACAVGFDYVPEIKLAKLYVPAFCRNETRGGYEWKDDKFGGYWTPTADRPGQVFIRGYVDMKTLKWVPEKWEKERPGYVFDQGHYNADGSWDAGQWVQVQPGYKWTPGRYNADGSWVDGAVVVDPSYVAPLTCAPAETMVAAVSLTKLQIASFCRPVKKKDMQWVDDKFGGWWKPTKMQPGRIFSRGYWNKSTKSWVEEEWLLPQAGKQFVAGHYAGNGEWVPYSWIEAKAGYTWKDGSFAADGSWVDGQWVAAPSGYKSGGY